MLLSPRGFMLLLFGSLLLLSCINFVSSEPKVVHMQTNRVLRKALNKRDAEPKVVHMKTNRVLRKALNKRDDTSDVPESATVTESAEAAESTDAPDAAETAEATGSTEATETADSTDATETAESTDTAEATESTDTTETAESTDTAEATESTDPTETAESTDTAEATESTDPTETAESTDASEATESADATETSESTDVAEATASADATETAESTDAAEATESADATETADSTDATETSDSSEATETGDSGYSNDALEKSELTMGNVFNFVYYVNTTMGTPGQHVALQVDTGSSDTWVPKPDVGLSKGTKLPVFFHANESSSYAAQTKNYTGGYVDGRGIAGSYFNDDIAFNDLTVNNVTMVWASQADGFYAGLLGLGLPSLQADVQSSGGQPYVSILEQMVSQDLIKTKTFSMWSNEQDSEHGNILFGGYDKSKFDGDLQMLAIQPPHDQYTVLVTSMLADLDGDASTEDDEYGYNVGGGMAVVLDSGTSSTYVPSEVFDSLAEYLLVTYAPASDDYIVPCNVGGQTGGLWFQFGSSEGPWIYIPFKSFAVPNDNITVDAGDQNPDDLCSFGLRPNNGSKGTNYFGDTFLRSAYVLYDLENMQIGIAQANYDATAQPQYYEITGKDDTGPAIVPDPNAPVITQTGPAFRFPPGGQLGAVSIASMASATATPSTLSGVEKTSGDIKKASATSSDAAATSSKSAASPPAALELSTVPVILLALCGSMMLMGAFIV